MKLGELIAGTDIVCEKSSLEVKGISSDSRTIHEGYVFICHKGHSTDGHRFALDALQRGAACIICEDRAELPVSIDCEVLKTGSSRLTESVIWNNFYGCPADGMKKIAVTGTAGKTSTVFILRHILRAAGYKVGIITTIKALAGDEYIDLGEHGGSSVVDKYGAMTTPDPEYFFRAAAVMKNKGCDVIIYEASSQALEQRRVGAVHPDYALFTNLSHEHLDYHGDMESYFSAKALLMEKAEIGIINADDSYMSRLPKLFPNKRMIICSADPAKVAEADVSALRYRSHGADGTEYVYFSVRAVFKIRTPQLGKHSVYNTMLAAACAIDMGADLMTVKEALSDINGIDGRLYRVRLPERSKVKAEVFIDYAHTPEALRAALSTLNDIKQNRLIVLFGCGGDRDRSKRSEMAEAAQSIADYTIITNDNPRTEDPSEIIEDILSGIDKTKEYAVIPNRYEAIYHAADMATDGDIILLAGKGHEKYEITAAGKKYFDEEKIVRQAFKID